MLNLILWAWFLAALAMVLLWLLQLKTKDASHVDVGWAAFIGVCALAFAALGTGESTRRWLLAVLGGVWSARLAGYLLFNRVLGKPEDRRYAQLRSEWGNKAQPKFFIFFQAQAVLVVVFALAFLPIAFDPRKLTALPTILALALWTTAIFGETLADLQLARFRADPQSRGKTCQVGLWKYSRHPNYFFEWLHWWTYVVLAWGAPHAWLAWIAPALLILLLFKVTGIPATEAQALRSRGSEYAAYQKQTSVFVPWFPKRDV